ncbi:MAG: hypothetical protein IJ629_07400 [Clostridia bacterium]|nr:hypothetical protein [Clostridia bacterium]
MKKTNHLSPQITSLKILSPNEILGTFKPHIVIDRSGNNYTLLDKDLHEIDTIKQISAFNIFTHSRKLKSFRKQLKKDLKKYKKTCKLLGKEVDHNFLKMHKDILYYLDLCPDADYCILELIRRNITHMNIGYSNYQTACAEYLHELAKLTDGDPTLMPVTINYATINNRISSKHKYISNSFISYSNDCVSDFIDIFRQLHSRNSAYLRCHSYFEPDYTTDNLENSKYNRVKNVYSEHEEDITR